LGKTRKILLNLIIKNMAETQLTIQEPNAEQTRPMVEQKILATLRGRIDARLPDALAHDVGIGISPGCQPRLSRDYLVSLLVQGVSGLGHEGPPAGLDVISSRRPQQSAIG
jgi:hypothetical protein